MTTDAHLHYLVIRNKIINLRKTAAKVNPLENSSAEQITAWLSVAQAALNLPGAVPSAQMAQYDGDDIEAFSMTIDGRQVVGYVWKVGFVEGEEVEVAGFMRGDIFDAVAVRDVERRLVWLRPYYSMGSYALRQSQVRRILKVCAISNVMLLFGFPALAWLMSTGGGSWLALFGCLILVCGIFDLICIQVLRTHRRLDFSREVDAIGRAFLLANPEAINFDESQRHARAAGKPYVSGAKYY